MSPSATAPFRRHLLGGVVAALVVLAANGQAQTLTETYALENVWLLPDVSHPTSAAQPLTGLFEWTYTSGDFENGNMQFLELDLPWSNAAIADFEFSADPGSIEIVMPVDLHNHGVDVNLVLAPLLAPGLPSAIDLVESKFDIEVGVSHKGHVISGDIVPTCPSLPAAAVVRAGSPPNPIAFQSGPTAGPVIAMVWEPFVDHTAFVPDSMLDFALVTTHPANEPFGSSGTLLCDLSSPLLLLQLAPAPGTPLALPVPDKCALVGATLSAQGRSIDATTAIHLTNALDLTIGSF